MHARFCGFPPSVVIPHEVAVPPSFLSVAIRFIGQPSKEHAFHTQRKKKEMEWASTIDAEIAAAESKAMKVRKRVVLSVVNCSV